MSKEAAKAFYTKQLGDPDSGYITPQDAMDSLDVVYADAVEAVQAELGTDPSGSAATVSARLDGIEAGTRLGAGSVGAAQLADNAVDTAAIQDGAVTSAKIADGTIVGADINASAAIAATKVAGTALVASTVDAKGDLYVGTAADTVARLAVGSDGALLVADSAQTAGVRWTTARHLEGTGVPEGAVTAPPGSTFLQTSGAATKTGMLSWRKISGSGSTGWVAEGALADTGTRDVAADLLNSYTGAAQIRRVGAIVELRLMNVTGATATAVYTLPTGFRTGNSETRLIVQRMISGSAYTSRAYMADGSGTTVSLAALSGTPAKASGDGWNLNHSWFTPDDWPSSLPGSAA